MSKVLVTGGAGYIGSILVPDLLADGHKVTVLDNFMYKQNSLAASAIHDNLEIEVGDIRDLKVLNRLVKENEIIVPLAAIVGAPACNKDPLAASSINLDVPLALIEMVDNEQQVIMPTTNSAYGTTKPGEVSTEESPLNPISTYAIHKVEVETALMQKRKSVSFRLATVFGMSPRMRLDLLVNDLCYRAIHERSVVLFESGFVRNYVHIRDVSKVIRWAINNEKAFGEIFNFGLSDANLSKKELCIEIQKYVPNFVYVEAEFGKDPDQRNYTVSNRKIEKTGFEFSYSLKTGLQELVKGLRTLNNKLFTNL